MPRGLRIGEIVRLQVQRVPIKIKGVGYVPSGIQQVDRAAVDAWGVVGWHEDAWIIDAHHRAHPAQRGGGRRTVSIGFTGHYADMAERFGSAPVGIAGENIIIDGPPLWLDGLGDGIIIETSAGDEIRFERPRVAAPCLEFTSFMLGLDHVASLDEIAEPLADLHDGRRGFIVSADHAPKPVEFGVGDVAYFSQP
jgi:hypothetical protein